MYQIKLYDYVPKPNPATSDRIVAAHYYPSWKKGAAGLHNGFDDLHNYPERTPLCGYYDGDSPEYCDWEIKWALEHGVNCFVFCWYRKKDNVGKPVTPSDLRLGETLHDGFLKARYSNMMKFAIMFETSLRWGAADAEDLYNNLMPFWIEEYFSKENYLKIDNKPVLFVYDHYGHQLASMLGSPEEQSAVFDRCREIARSHGFDGLIIASENHYDDIADVEELFRRGYDYNFAYGWSFREPKAHDDRIIESQLSKIKARIDAFPDRFIPTVGAMWDPTPRFYSMPEMYSPQRNVSLWKLAPKNWRRLLHDARELCNAMPQSSLGRNMIFLDNWNEWDEGHYLLPSVEFGFQYLQAIREEFTQRDNLPDYRMPHDVGTAPLNTQWKEPDLSGIRPHLKAEDGSNEDIYN